MHITLTGNLGSGKSTICRILESKYGYEIYSTGKVQRKLASDLGLTVLEMNQKMCSDPSFDHMIDDTTASISRDNPEKKIVFDSRLAWNFVASSFKVFVSVNIDEAARRVWNDNRGDVERYSSVADAKKQLQQRAETENARYRSLYQLNYFDFNNYNLVLDSTHCTPDFLADLVIAEAELYEKKLEFYASGVTKILMSPHRLHFDGEDKLPTLSVGTSTLAYDKDESTPCITDGADYRITGDTTAVTSAVMSGIPLIQISLP